MATNTKISDQIFGKCSAALSVDASRCDGITALNIEPTLSSDLNNIYKSSNAGGDVEWRLMNLLLEADFVGKSCFPRQYGMYDWLQSITKKPGSKRLTLGKVNNGLWELYPFVKMERKGPINNEFWTFSAGATSGGTPAGTTWKGTVKSQTGVPGDVRWFPKDMRVSISNMTSLGQHGVTQWKIATAAMNADTISVDITLVPLNSGSAFATTNADKISNPTVGVLLRNTANVSDYEKYCDQIPGLNTKQLSPFWIETTRWSYRFCELMEKYLDAIRKNNPLFREFGDVDSVELNRQIQQDFERRDAWSFFFNKPLPNQTLNTYEALEKIFVANGTITNPNGGQLVGRRAAATGLYEQHAECGRVFDLQGQTLNLQEWFQSLYQIQRVRQGNGLPGQMIEVYTDDAYAIQLQQGFIRYFSMRSEGLLRLNMDISSKVEQGPFGFRFRRFQLDFPDVELRIVTHPFFNDLLQAHTLVNSSTTQAGRCLWVIDWSVNYPMVFDANSIMLTSGDINRLAEIDYASYGCVMKLPKDRQKLMSKTYTNVVECAQASQIIENFSFAVPEHKGPSGTYGDLYGIIP